MIEIDPRDPDWSTLPGLGRIRERLAAGIDGWVAPVAWGVLADEEIPVVNRPGGRHGLASVALASVLGHDGSTATLPLTAAQLHRAVELLSPAEQCPGIDHPNVAAWRVLLDTGRQAYAVVFVRDLGDRITSEPDRWFRAALLR